MLSQIDFSQEKTRNLDQEEQNKKEFYAVIAVTAFWGLLNLAFFLFIWISYKKYKKIEDAVKTIKKIVSNLESLEINYGPVEIDHNVKRKFDSFFNNLKIFDTKFQYLELTSETDFFKSFKKLKNRKNDLLYQYNRIREVLIEEKGYTDFFADLKLESMLDKLDNFFKISDDQIGELFDDINRFKESQYLQIFKKCTSLMESIIKNRVEFNFYFENKKIISISRKEIK